jgi:aspartate ammonia-lyase
VRNSIGIVTALNPYIGYDNATSIAKEAFQTGASVYDLVLRHKLMNKAALDEVLRAEVLTQPRAMPARKPKQKIKRSGTAAIKRPRKAAKHQD